MQISASCSAVLFTLDWGQAVSAVIGATVGALVGVIGTATVARRARKFEAAQAAAAALERAIENLLRSLVNLTATTAAWQQAVMLATWAPGDRPSARPDPGEVSIALELVKLRAMPTDRDVTDRLSAAWDLLANGEGIAQSRAYGLFATAVVAWRAGEELPAIDNALSVAKKVAKHGLVDDESTSEV